MTQATFARARGVFLALVVLGTVLYCTTVVPGVRDQPGFDTRYDAWLQGSVYVLMAAGSVVPVVLRRRERRFWGLLAASLVLRTIGFVVYWSSIRMQDPQPYPSVSDLFWVSSTLCLILAVVAAVRRISPVLTRIVVLDGLMAALTSAAYGLALIGPTLNVLVSPGAPSRVVLTNLTYPILDVALIAMVAGLVMTLRLDTSWAIRMALLGMLTFSVIDGVYLYLLTTGSWRAGTWVNAVSMLAMGLLAMSTWYAPPAREVAARVARVTYTPLETPIAFAALCTGLFVVDAYYELPKVSMLLAAAAILVAMRRGVRTMSTDRRESRRVIRATEDERLKFQALVDTSGDFIAIAGLDGQVAYLNPAGRRMIGLSPRADVTRTTIPDYLTEEGLRASIEVEQPAVISQGHWEGESTLRHRPDGRAIPVEISSFLMHHPETGEPMALATVQRDISERLATERQLAALAEQRRQLLARLVRAEEVERARIAADVHDDSVQALAVVDLRLGMLRSRVEGLSTEQVENLDRLHESVTQAIGRLRQLLFDLEPPGGDVDLGTALADAAGHLFQGTGVGWQVTGDGGPELAVATRVTAYRIAKEAMVNVLKHAGAERVEIRVESCPDEGVRVSVIDDGTGFDPAAQAELPGHLGLGGMSDRATVAGGRLEVESAPGGGTTVRLWLPEGEPDETA